MSSAAETVRYERSDRVALITLSRPEVLNAFSRQLGEELQVALRRADADDEVRAVVIAGEGRAFCAGADFSGGAGVFDSPRSEPDRPFRSDPFDFHPWDVRKPVIGAIHGAAIGLGLTMTLQFDIRIVADDAKLALAQVQRGVMADLHTHWTLPRLIGHARATELMLTGRRFTGTDAAAWGLALEALPADEVLDRALELGRDIATTTAPVSVGVTKRLLWWPTGLDASSADDLETRLHEHLMGGPDAREGVMAWMEKRDPDWSWSVTRNWPDWFPATGADRG